MIHYLYIITWLLFFYSRKKYEWVCERVIVLAACYTNKRPTTMWLAKKKKKKKKKKTKYRFSWGKTNSHITNWALTECWKSTSDEHSNIVWSDQQEYNRNIGYKKGSLALIICRMIESKNNLRAHMYLNSLKLQVYRLCLTCIICTWAPLGLRLLWALHWSSSMTTSILFYFIFLKQNKIKKIRHWNEGSSQSFQTPNLLIIHFV